MQAPTASVPPPAIEQSMLGAEKKWGAEGYAEGLEKREWTLRAVGLFCEGKKLEDALIYLNAVAFFDGRRDHRGFRHDQAGAIQYPNGDRYFGPYVHGKRKGAGIYFFHDGGIYLGNYDKGLRSGLGIHITKKAGPDNRPRFSLL